MHAPNIQNINFSDNDRLILPTSIVFCLPDVGREPFCNPGSTFHLRMCRRLRLRLFCRSSPGMNISIGLPKKAYVHVYQGIVYTIDPLTDIIQCIIPELQSLGPYTFLAILLSRFKGRHLPYSSNFVFGRIYYALTANLHTFALL